MKFQLIRIHNLAAPLQDAALAHRQRPLPKLPHIKFLLATDR